MNILVSGGNGYIGTRLVDRLLLEGHQVTILVKNRGATAKLFEGRSEIVECDVTKPFNFELKHAIDIFIHLAAANDIDSRDPQKAISISCLGTRYALEYCQTRSITKFLYFSTFQVYGKVEGLMNEDTLTEPANDYAITHLFAEQYVKMFYRIAGIRYIILRPTNIFGVPMTRDMDRWSLVPLCFCKEAFEHGEINLLSSGKQRRDFLCLDDLVRLVSLYCHEFDKFKCSTLNISSGNIYSILEIANIVVKRYEQIFAKKCEIKIHSQFPKIENDFQIDRKEQNKLDFRFSGREKIETEIEEIFCLLNSKNNLN
jgi:nucleoside-diphosphate-sugar epimerase